MVKTYVPAKRVEVKARITEDLHSRLVAEAGHCGCHLNGFIAIAIANEIASRKSRRKSAADRAILAGQLSIEGEINARND